MTATISTIHDRLGAIEARFDELERLMGDPDTASQPAKLAEYGRERAEIEEVVNAYRNLKGIESQIAEAELLSADGGDPEMAELAAAELEELRPAHEAAFAEIRALLVP